MYIYKIKFRVDENSISVSLQNEIYVILCTVHYICTSNLVILVNTNFSKFVNLICTIK